MYPLRRASACTKAAHLSIGKPSPSCHVASCDLDRLESSWRAEDIPSDTEEHFRTLMAHRPDCVGVRPAALPCAPPLPPGVPDSIALPSLLFVFFPGSPEPDPPLSGIGFVAALFLPTDFDACPGCLRAFRELPFVIVTFPTFASRSTEQYM